MSVSCHVSNNTLICMSQLWYVPSSLLNSGEIFLQGREELGLVRVSTLGAKHGGYASSAAVCLT